jgi:DNA-binding XRE family transcriptional regulator
MGYELRLEELRKSKGMTQEQVCRYLDIASSTYRNMEKNKYSKFNFVLLFKMRDLFELGNIEDLFIKK